jgi:hypothetical protein
VPRADAVIDAEGPDVEALFTDPMFVERCALVVGQAGAYSSEGTMYCEHLRQLHQWELWRAERSRAAEARGGVAWPALEPQLQDKCRRVFASQQGRPSKMQRQVLAAVRSLGLEAEEEVTTPQGYSIDILVKLPAPGADAVAAPAEGGDGSAVVAAVDTIAIEVDGPTHFLHYSRRASGSTQLKRRQLRRAGWRLVSVPYFDWPRPPKDRTEVTTEQREYLAALLSAEDCGVEYQLGAAGACGSEEDVVQLQPPERNRTRSES